MSIDPQWLARYVSDLGGDVQYDTPNFRFELPLSEVRRVIPEINKLGLACDRVSERQGRDVNGRACSIATIKVSHAPEKTEYEEEKSLMRICLRD